MVVERPEHHDHPGIAELVAQPHDRRRDHAEVLGDHGQLAELRLDGAEECAAWTSAPATVTCGLVPLRNRPVRDEPTEVVDARQVDELEGAAKALRPPAVSR